MAAPSSSKWNQELPVVVVGAGLAGLCAAAQLRKTGVNVVVVEAQDYFGYVIHSSVY